MEKVQAVDILLVMCETVVVMKMVRENHTVLWETVLSQLFPAKMCEHNIHISRHLKNSMRYYARQSTSKRRQRTVQPTGVPGPRFLGCAF